MAQHHNQPPSKPDHDKAARVPVEPTKVEEYRKPETAAGKRMADDVATIADKTERVVALKTVLYRGTARREGEEFDMLASDVAECRRKGKVRLPGEPAPVAAKPGESDDTDASTPQGLPPLKDGTVYVRAIKTMLYKGAARGKGEVFAMGDDRAQQRKARGEVKILS
jgi:hypothetical protein